MTDISDNVACLQLISRPSAGTIRVSIGRLRHCPAECCPEGVEATEFDDGNPENATHTVTASNRNNEDSAPKNASEEPAEEFESQDTLRQSPPAESHTRGTMNEDSLDHPWTTRPRPRRKVGAMTSSSSVKDWEM